MHRSLNTSIALDTAEMSTREDHQPTREGGYSDEQNRYWSQMGRISTTGQKLPMTLWKETQMHCSVLPSGPKVTALRPAATSSSTIENSWGGMQYISIFYLISGYDMETIQPVGDLLVGPFCSYSES
jgi:hypothetical protein